MPQTIEVNNVGPIERLTIPIPEEGGIVVLRGRNGSGKTHAINGVEALYSRAARKTIEKKDGVPSGTIDGLGVTVRLGRSTTVRGELLVDSLDGRVDPSQLVDPGLKDPEKADAKRLATLVRLAGISVSVDDWVSAAGEFAGEIAVAELVDGDPVSSADKLRRRLHEWALSRERIAESQAAEAAVICKSVADVEDEPADEQELAKEYESASNALAVAEQKRDAFSKAVESRNNASEQLAKLGTVDCELIKQGCDEIGNSVAELNMRVEGLEKSLDEARRALDLARTRLVHENELLDAATKHALARETFQQILDDDLPSTVSNDELNELVEQKEQARVAIQRGEVVRRARAERMRAAELEGKSQSIAKSAEKARQLARSTDTVLEQALVDAGFVAVKVHDGRLCVESDRGLEAFSDLSHGERWRFALELAAKGLPEGSVLPVCQEAFESLDPDNRSGINAIARELGIVLVTAEATDGELRAEVLS